MSTNDQNVPPMIRQQQLVQKIGGVISRFRVGDWQTSEYQTSSLVGYQEHMIYLRLPNGSVEPEFPPDELIDLTEDLRHVMYRPGAGTWFSATINIGESGRVSADFNYDDEPYWETGIAPVLYTQDLEKYPRDDAQVPDWLRQRLAEAEGGSTN